MWRKKKARLRGVSGTRNKGTGQDAILNRVLRVNLVEKAKSKQRSEGEEEAGKSRLRAQGLLLCD